jgi:hypothetical protein
MRYVFHALAPHDQLVYFDESTKALKPFEGELENEGRQVKVLFLDSEGKESIKNVSYDDIAAEYRFQYMPRLVFAQESDLRNMSVSWGLDEDVFPSAESLGFAGELLRGSVCDSIALKFISESMGAGLFATCKIPKQSFIGEYCGVVGHGSRSGKPSAYALNFPSGDSHEIDSLHVGSLMRFCNHSDSPNCFFRSVWLDCCVHVVVMVGDVDVEAGCQLTVDYGKGYWLGQGGEVEPI